MDNKNLFSILTILLSFTIVIGLQLTGCQEGNNPVNVNISNPIGNPNQPNHPPNAFTTNIIAGQNIDVGDIFVWNDNVNLYVQYMTTNNWWLNKTHLHVATSLSGIPQTQSGNPKVGNFDYQSEHNPHVQSYTYPITIAWILNTELYLAAHCEVVLKDNNGNIIQQETGWGQGYNFPGNNWAMYFTYNLQVPSQCLVAYYPFNGNANDESGNGFNGVVHGATLTTDRFGYIDKAYYFDGSGDYIGLPPFIDYEEIGDFTLSLWAKMEAHPPLGRSYLIDFRGDGTYTNNSFFMIIDEVFGESEIHHGIDYYEWVFTEYEVNISSPIGNWVHFILLREGDNLKTYKDGNLLPNNFTTRSVPPRSDIVSLSYGGRIGTTSTFTTPIEYWCKSIIDDIRVYNYALTNSEIQDLYHEGGYGN
jgi:hypothetical protein